jgi:hypothetical protein
MVCGHPVGSAVAMAFNATNSIADGRGKVQCRCTKGQAGSLFGYVRLRGSHVAASTHVGHDGRPHRSRPASCHAAGKIGAHMKRNHMKGLAILGGLFVLCLGCGAVVDAFDGDDASPATQQQPARAVDLPTTSATSATSATTSPAVQPTATTTRPTTTARPTTPRAIRTTPTQRATTRRTTTRRTTTPRPRRTTTAPREVYYANCSAVRAAGADPIRRGDPGYSRKLDRDGDGVACE